MATPQWLEDERRTVSDSDFPTGPGSPAGPGAGPDTDPRWRMTPTKYVVTAILLVAIVVPLLVPSYARVDPRLFGFPFFYWYQLAWVFLAAGCCSLSFFLLKRERDALARRGAVDRHDPAGERR